MLDRDQLIEIVVAVSAVLLMLGSMMYIGTEYGGENGALAAEGGELLVGAIVGFILLLTAVGIVLAYVMNDPEDGLESETDDDADAQNAV